MSIFICPHGSAKNINKPRARTQFGEKKWKMHDMLNCACYRQTEPPKTLEKPTKNDKILRCTPDCLFMCAQSKKHEKPRGLHVWDTKKHRFAHQCGQMKMDSWKKHNQNWSRLLLRHPRICSDMNPLTMWHHKQLKTPAPALWLDSWLPQFDLVQCGMFRDIS